MSRMKTFLKYLFLFLAFYIFVSFMSYEFVKTTPKTMQNYSIEFQNPEITILDAQSSNVNGYVKGVIKNNTSETISDKYIKVDFLSDLENVIISKYIKIDSLDSGGKQNFEVNFNAENIKSFKMNLVDKKEETDLKINTKEVIGVAGGILLVWLLVIK